MLATIQGLTTQSHRVNGSTSQVLEYMVVPLWETPETLGPGLLEVSLSQTHLTQNIQELAKNLGTAFG